MAKNKKKQKSLRLIGLISRTACLIFALIAILMIFTPFVKITVGQEVIKYTGCDVTFGLTQKVLVSSQQIFAFSFMNLLPFLLVVSGLVCAVASFLKKGGKLMTFIGFVLLLVAGILFFFPVTFCVPGDNWGSQISGIIGASSKEGLEVAIGAIMAGVFSILSALALLVKPVLSSMK